MENSLRPTPRRGKIFILSAPSGSGKSSVIRELLPKSDLRLGFSISATSRPPRGEERHGVEYYFLSSEEFRTRAGRGEFAEWEEVYPGVCYGTLLSEIERVVDSGRNLIMDVDVKGGLNLKKLFGQRAVAIFILPPSIEELERRLRSRATDSESQIEKRLAKAEYELSFAPRFDYRVVNDSLPDAVGRVEEIIRNSGI